MAGLEGEVEEEEEEIEGDGEEVEEEGAPGAAGSWGSCGEALREIDNVRSNHHDNFIFIQHQYERLSWRVIYDFHSDD